MPVHVAITRKVRPGCERQFEDSLRRFFKDSFGCDGVLGVHCLLPPPGSGSREYGILRTFENAELRDAFYNSSFFKEWDEQAQQWCEEEPQFRELHGLECWFRNPHAPPPPRWKMAALIWTAVWPCSMLVGGILTRFAPGLPYLLRTAIGALLVVLALTWFVMPLLTRWFRKWLTA